MSFLVGVVLCSMTATGPGAAQQPELESEPSAHHMNRAVLVSQHAGPGSDPRNALKSH